MEFIRIQSVKDKVKERSKGYKDKLNSFTQKMKKDAP